MNVIAFIAAVVAFALFLAEYYRGRSLLALGLAVLDLAWVISLTWHTTHIVHF